jgi:hypothetical protein
VNPMATAQERLRQASGVASILGAAHEAFESMLAAIWSQEDPATGLFAAFMMAAALAADGRDAVAFAPSMPPRRGRNAPVPEDLSAEKAAEIVGAVVGLSSLIAARLAQAAEQATGPSDREACNQAAWCACGIQDLMAGGGP